MNALQQLKTNGWCVLKNIIPEPEVHTVRDSVLQTVAQHRRDSAADSIGFVPGLIAHNQSFAPYLADARLMSICETLLGHDIRISYTSAIVNEPGNARGKWHADWPFNQNNAGHIPTPYPDAVFHLATLWMLSPFTEQNGGTLIMPGSHRANYNPTADCDIDPLSQLPGEMQPTGPAGSVLILDSRMWHATASNHTEEPRVALAVRYAPWWLNLDILMPDSDERKRMVTEPDRTDNEVPPVPCAIYKTLPENIRRLYRHWVK